LNDLVTRLFENEPNFTTHEEVARFNVLYRNKACQNYILLAIRHYTEALNLDTKHVYQALPRLLSLWFDFLATNPPDESSLSLKKENISKFCDTVD